MKTGATLFQGFDGVGVGMKAAGIQHVWGIEKRADVTAVAERNGLRSIAADILSVDPSSLNRVDFLHASPPCTNASVANSGATETALDISLVEKVIEFIRILKPEFFTLENVWFYRSFASFANILSYLEAAGYWVDVQKVNAADFGVPQTRQRLLLRAHMGGWLPLLPPPVSWTGWYQAIEDLLPALPDTQFANWQLDRLFEDPSTCLVGGANTSKAQARRGVGVSAPGEPAMCVTAEPKGWRAFLVNTNQSGDDGETLQVKDGEEPAFTTKPSDAGRLRALLLGVGTRSEFIDRDQPAQTITGNSNQLGVRAFIVDGQNSKANGGLSVREQEEPSITITASAHKGLPRAWLENGRVVKITPRCLARFQSFPDTYELPARTTLACYGIGNAVPPLMMEKIYKQLLEVP